MNMFLKIYDPYPPGPLTPLKITIIVRLSSDFGEKRCRISLDFETDRKETSEKGENIQLALRPETVEMVSINGLT
jgi:hypothetical protein